ncbi:MAG: hypothetical protein DWQ07_18105 [Chloroflexi bacterium]|nr:MAG: hypothetical protein DWQ07_18105 [Chloroflexota bacterium]
MTIDEHRTILKLPIVEDSGILDRLLPIAIALAVLPDVVNLGFRMKWGRTSYIGAGIRRLS